jgi:hypothetical protein
MFEIRQTEIYFEWFSTLRDRQAKARINIRIRRLSMGISCLVPQPWCDRHEARQSGAGG